MICLDEIKYKMQEHKKQMELYAEFATPCKHDEAKAKIYYYHLREFNEARKQYNILLDELATEKRQSKQNETSKTFVNNFGEATTRDITTGTYEKARKKLNNQILNLVS